MVERFPPAAQCSIRQGATGSSGKVALVKIKTTRFGEVEIDETKIIKMRRDTLGFEGLNSFTIITKKDIEPYMWLQSLYEDSIAFLVVNPQKKANYPICYNLFPSNEDQTGSLGKTSPFIINGKIVKCIH